MTPRVADLVTVTLEGYDRLLGVADALDDELLYAGDLRTVWTSALRVLADERGSEPAPPGAAEAIAALVDEAGLVADPHRALDWCSTFPQVALAALGTVA